MILAINLFVEGNLQLDERYQPSLFVFYSYAFREAIEETSLQITLKSQFHTYSDPKRDSRRHTITTVYTAKAKGRPVAADDAREIGIFTKDEIPQKLAFDHKKILSDYFKQ